VRYLLVFGRVISTGGLEYPELHTSVGSCIERFGLDEVSLDADVGQGIALLLEDVRPLVEVAARRCDVGARWGGLLTWLQGVAPAAVHLASTGADAPVPAVHVDLTGCGREVGEVIARGLTGSSSRASLLLAHAGVRP
jgi:hypothetical protein